MHSDILASLDYAVEQKEGFSLIIGEPGTGKTTILKIFMDRWKDRAEIALVLTPRLLPEELLQAVLDDFKIDHATTSKNEMFKVFRNFLIDRSLAGKRVIIIVDEAQNLSDESLEELRLLSNLETDKEKLLQIILVGQTELLKKLKSESMRQLDQRITIRATVRPLTLDETADYISFRLIKGGKGSAIFDEKVKKTIFRLSGGIPRLVNLITSRAMMAAYVGTVHQIRKGHVLDAVAHLSNAQPRAILWQKRLGYAIAGLLICLLIPALYLGYGKYRSSGTASPLLNKAGNTSAISKKPAIKATAPRTSAPTRIIKKVVVAVPAARLRVAPSVQDGIRRMAPEGERLEVIE
jgi:general secretion pathway protein A